MADVHDRKTRSYSMSQDRSKDTRPEQEVCRYTGITEFVNALNFLDLY